MCGIFGYIGSQQAQPILMKGLKRLEYRGYEGAGIATVHERSIRISKVAGKVAELEAEVKLNPVAGTIGIAHNRWPTHGKKSYENTHPHVSKDFKIAVVHNGVIRNHDDLRSELKKSGCVFYSETDTEILAQLIDAAYERHPAPIGEYRLLRATEICVRRLVGSYSVAVISSDIPDSIVFARNGSELVAGINDEGETFLASDVEALRGYATRFMRIKDGEIGSISRRGISILEARDAELQKRMGPMPAGKPAYDKGGYPHFMLKEIMEQPEVIKETLLAAPAFQWDDIISNWRYKYQTEDHRIILAGCGTSMHAGLVGKLLIENFAYINVDVVGTSETESFGWLADPGYDPIIGISQSGETADTLAFLRKAKELRFHVGFITNRENSAMWDLADTALNLGIGIEYAVASTKAFTGQAAALACFAVELAKRRAHERFGEQPRMFPDWHKLEENIRSLPALLSQALTCAKQPTRLLAQELKDHQRWIVIGRGYGVPLALEGALKLKEVAYVDAHAFPAGELKHGTLALVEDGTPVVAIIPQNKLREKMLSNISEVLARGGHIIALTTEDDVEVRALGDTVTVLPVPKGPEELSPIFMAPALQLLSYHLSVCRGINPDQPRNLAKSVTVE